MPETKQRLKNIVATTTKAIFTAGKVTFTLFRQTLLLDD
jgi:hypothetical protein